MFLHQRMPYITPQWIALTLVLAGVTGCAPYQSRPVPYPSTVYSGAAATSQPPVSRVAYAPGDSSDSNSPQAPYHGEGGRRIVRGQQPAYGGQVTNPLPNDFGRRPVGPPTYQPPYMATQPPASQPPYAAVSPANHRIAQQPPAGMPSAAGQPYVPPGYQPHTPQPAGTGLGGLWQGQPWVQPVNQPPFVPSSPLVTPDEVMDVDVMLEETQTGRLVIGAGINSDAGLVGNIVIDEQNFDLWRWPTSFQDFRTNTAFRGAGQRFRIELVPGTRVQRYSFNFTEPYLFQTPINFGLSGFYYDRVYTDWDEDRKGGRTSIGYIFPHRPDLSTSLALRYEQIGITDVSVPTLKDFKAVMGDNDLLGLQWTVAHDTRDSTVKPTEGHLIQLSFEQVTGTFSYPKFRGDFRRYFVMSERPDGSGRHILGFSGRVGISGKDTPIYDRFFAGGFSTIRGFGFRGASPTASGVIVGGELELIGSAEYRFPLTAGDGVHGSFFLDVGTVEEVASVTASDIRITPGFELRVGIPALGPIPIAIGLGFPIQHEDGDDIQNFHFFVGVSR